MDEEGLRAKLPALMDGASKWIACLEKNTAHISLAKGDIKSLLSSSTKMREFRLHHTCHHRDQAIGTLDSSNSRQGTWQ